MSFFILPSQETTDRANAACAKYKSGWSNEPYEPLTREDFGYAGSDDFKAYLGVPINAKWPEGYINPVEVPLKDGRVTQMWLYAQKPGAMYHRYDSQRDKVVIGRRKVSTHRCYVECPDCHHPVPAGRCHQHKCKGK